MLHDVQCEIRECDFGVLKPKLKSLDEVLVFIVAEDYDFSHIISKLVEGIYNDEQCEAYMVSFIQDGIISIAFVEPVKVPNFGIDQIADCQRVLFAVAEPVYFIQLKRI